MKSISQGFGLEKTFTLSEVEPEAEEQKTVKATPEIIRVPPEELEYAYIKHPIIFNAINKATQAIMSAGWELKCDDPQILEYFKSFLGNIGKVGENITFEEILESLFQYQLIYGNAFLETVLNKYRNNIVDLVVLDPKRIDYAKKGDGTIVLDKFGKPIGYTQKLPYVVSVTGKGDPIPQGSEVSLMENNIFLIPERICHFKLYTYGDRFYGQGLIEAAYSSIIYEMNIRKSMANSIEQKGIAPLVDYVGDPLHEPTPPQIQNALEKMRKFKSNRYFAFPYWHKITPIEAKPNDIIENFLKYLREDICASLGVPTAFSIGSGEATNRSTLETQQLLMTYTLNDIVKRTLAIIHKQIFKRICDYNGFQVVPRLVWGYIGIEELNQKHRRLVNYAKAGGIDLEKLKAYVNKSEKLD